MRLTVLTALVLVAMASAAVVPSTRKLNVELNNKVVQHMVAGHLSRSSQKPPAQPQSEKSKRVVVENFFTTRVDHFNPQDTREWTLRYLAVTDHYLPRGPILIRLSGMFPIQPFMVDESSLIYEMGRDMNAAVFAFESRFYGESWVTEDVSTENLRLLNADQILADLAEFVTYLRREVLEDENAPVVVAGEGLGGALATWFRVRYPHLASATWSSSGFHDARVNFREFAEAWGQTLIDHGSQACYNEIFVAFNVMQNLIDVGLSDILSERLNICSPIDPENTFQVQYFFAALMTTIEISTLYNQNLADFSTVCEEITGITEDTAVDVFATWFNGFFDGEDGNCLNSDPMETVALFQEDDWNSPLVTPFPARQVLYQECTEYGWFPVTEGTDQPFGSRVTVDFFVELCQQVFGEWITSETMHYGAQRANNRFGGLSPRVERVHFTNGGEDPARMVGITRDLNALALADVIPNELLGSDMPAISEDDSEELEAVKRSVKGLMSYYIYLDMTPGLEKVSEA